MKKTRNIVAIFAILFLTSCGTDRDSDFLKRYMNQDLLELNEETRIALFKRLERILGKDDTELLIHHRPKYVWEFHGSDGKLQFALLCKSMSGMWAGATIFLLDQDCKLLKEIPVRAGWRMGIVDAKFYFDQSFNLPVLMFHSAPGIHGRDVARQYYGLIDDRFVLLRLEDSHGEGCTNLITHPNHTFGPFHPPRPVEYWTWLLQKAGPARALEAMNWIGGEFDMKDIDMRDRKADEMVFLRNLEEVRNHPDILNAIKQLQNAEHPWVRENAVRAVKELTRMKPKAS
jgi:hypothetical protein